MFSLAQGPKHWEKTGDLSFSEGDFFGASLYYKNALKLDSLNLDLKYKYAESLRSYNDYEKAVIEYQTIYDNDKEGRFPESLFWLATMQKFNGNYENAGSNFRKFNREYKNKSSYFSVKSKQEMKSCEYAKTLATIPQDAIVVKNIGDLTNTTHSEFSPIPINDTVFYFASMRTEKVSGEYIITDKNDYYMKLYAAKKIGELWETKGELDTIFSDSAFHTANGTFNRDKTKFWFTRCTKDFKCSIYSTNYLNAKWTQPVLLDNSINQSGTTSTQPHVAVVDNEEVLFFVSDRDRGRGKLDIWYSVISNSGEKYSNPKNLGKTINSIDNEVSPYYDEKNKTLYFSSEWHYGLGGFDVFKSEGGLRSFSAPENSGLPINSSTNDLYFSFANTNEGFLVSNRKGSITTKGETCCNDIYTFKLPEKQKKTDSIKEKRDSTFTFETLNKYLPLTLYFHNDEPNPKSRDTITKLNYIETYESYSEMIETYKTEYSRGLDESEVGKAKNTIETFFSDYVDKGVSNLELFTELLLKELEKGEKIILTVKGYASPLAKSDYNVNLTLRRISSMINYMKSSSEGAYLPYLNKTAKNDGSLEFIKIPFGEYKSDTTVSDNLNDQRNSVYSKSAALERKIEILSVTEAIVKPKEAILTFETDTHDFGEIKEGTIVKHTFKFKNEGTESLILTDVQSSCGCTVAKWTKEPIASGETSEIEIEYDTKGKSGKDKKSIIIHSNASVSSIVLTIEGKIVKATSKN